ncbi:hypothetical protein SDJN03_27571, partial [Cucurbita argyrosperma subsp. sororia]
MSNVDLGIEGQPIEGTAPAVAIPETTSQSASRDQPTVVITLEALQSLIQTPTASVPSHVTLVPEAQVGVQVAIPPTISKELPGTTVVTEAPLRVSFSKLIFSMVPITLGSSINSLTTQCTYFFQLNVEKSPDSSVLNAAQ